MRKHLNTLYVTLNGAYLSKQGESVAVRIENEVKLRIPFVNLEGIVCIGHISCSPDLMGACAESGVSLSFLSAQGRFVASVNGYTSGNVLLRRAQYRAADSQSRTLEVVRSILTAKIANCRGVLLRSARDSADQSIASKLRDAARLLVPYIEKLSVVQDIDSARGLEGSAARLYFDHFNFLLRADSRFVMVGRSRRPPLDPVNALLSFVYTLLLHDAKSACESSGLDAAVGFLHRDRPGRPSLALDLMEEFRPYLADRLICSLINRSQVIPEEFEQGESGEIRISDDARKKLISSYQKRKEEEITHPFLKEKVAIGILLHIQARLLARHLRDELDSYPPFIWK